MRRLRAWLLRLGGLFDKTRRDRELAEELESHLQMHVEDNLRSGMGPEEARRRALLKLGGIEQAKEKYRYRRGIPFLETLGKDVGFGLRMLRKNSGFTVVAVLTLALGIGANTAIFSLLDAVLLKTLPVSHPEQLFTVRVETPEGGWMSNVPSELFQELRKAPQSFSGVFAFWREFMVVQSGTETYRIDVQAVSGDFYSTLGISPELGRLITPTDDVDTNQPRVAVISHSFWINHFGADPSVIGRTIYIERLPATVIGVSPPDFFGADRGANPDVTIPLGNPGLADLWVMGRLKPESNEKQARAEVDLALQRGLSLIRPRLDTFRARTRDKILSIRGGIMAGDNGGGGYTLLSYREPLQIVFLLSTAVLLIVCANIANLQLARSAARTPEIAVRMAMGAGRSRLVRQLLTENALLALFGTLLGMVFASYAHHMLVTLLLKEWMAKAVDFALDLHVIGYTSAVAITTTLLFGSITAMRATRINISAMLKGGTHTGSRLRLGPVKILIIAQVAASLALVVGAGLLARTLHNLRKLDAGFNSQNLLLMRIGASELGYEGPKAANFYREVVSRVQSLPGVSSASLGANKVFGSGNWNKSVWVEGCPPEEEQVARFNAVGPGFFATSGSPLLLGREFSEQDALGAKKVAIVNEAFARRFWPDQNPLGLHFGDHGAKSISQYEVIGLVKDVKYGTLRESTEPMIYQALLQDNQISNVTLHVRTRGKPVPLLARIREQIQAVNNTLPIYDVRTLKEEVDRSLQRDRMMAALSAYFGLLALLLTCIGLYGIVAFAVARRTKEIGVRVALGARSADLAWMIVRETLAMVVVGALLGIPVALASARLLATMLFGLKTSDMGTVTAALFAMLGVGIIAGYLPARRAARVDPMRALRYE